MDNMDNQYMTFWQNTFTDMFEKGNQLNQLDKLFEQSLTSFGEFTAMIQKMSRWDLFLTPVESPGMFDFRKSMDDYLKIIGLISIEEYRSLVNKYEELKKEYEKLGKASDDQKKKISELNQASSSEKKKLSAIDKNIEEGKAKLDEQKKINDKLTKDLAAEKKFSSSLEKELNELKSTSESLKKQVSEKEKNKAKPNTSNV